MLRILSVLAALPLALIVLVAVGLYTAYGEVDPCRVLAVERTRLAEAQTGADTDTDTDAETGADMSTDMGAETGAGAEGMEPWMRTQTSQLSTGQCAREMVRSWKGRVWGGEERADNQDEDRQYGDEPDYRARDNGDRDYGDYEDDSGYDRNGE
jgi:hypothetical protein